MALGELRRFLNAHFSAYSLNQRWPNMRMCLYPEQDIDRGGDSSPKTMAWHEEHRIDLEGLVARVRITCEAYPNVVKAELAEWWAIAGTVRLSLPLLWRAQPSPHPTGTVAPLH